MTEGKDVLKEYFGEDNLRLAFERYSRVKNPDTKDHYGLEIFKKNLDDNLKRLSNLLIKNTDSYSPEKPFKFLYPKKAIGISRICTIINIVDSIVYQAIVDKIASNNYDLILKNKDFVFSHHLNEGVAEGIQILDNIDISKGKGFFFKKWPELHNRYKLNRNQIIDNNKDLFILTTDLTSFYDTIQHSILKKKIEDQYCLDSNISKVLFKCLDAFSGTNEMKTPGVGIPQGPQPSEFLAELMLYDIDERIINYSNEQIGFLGYARYVDDIEVYADSAEVLLRILSYIDIQFKQIAISLNSSKTEIKPCVTEEEKKDQKKFFLIASSIGEDHNDLLETLGNKEESNLEKLTEIKPGSLFDSNIQEVRRYIERNDLIDLLPDDPEKLDDYIQSQKDIINKQLSNKPFDNLSLDTFLINDKHILNEIYTKINEILLKFEVISLIEKEINNEFHWNNEYLNCWFGIIRLFPAKSYQIFQIINRYYIKTNSLKDNLIQLYSNLEHSGYARNKLADILLSDLDFSFNSRELKILNQTYITNRRLIDKYSRKSFYLFLLIHFPSKDPLYNKILHSISLEDNFIKEWLLFRLTEKSQETMLNKKLNYTFLENFNPNSFAKSISYADN
jgi:hypothetical protein